MSFLWRGVQLTTAAAPTSGVFQVTTATVTATITTAGNATVTVTAAGMAGSPLAIPVAVAEADDSAAVAGKMRTTLAANATIAGFFTVSGATNAVILTRKRSAANDATLNIAQADGTSVGLTTAATSAATTAGVRGTYRGAPNGAYIIDTTNTIIYQNTGNHLKPTWAEWVPTS